MQYKARWFVTLDYNRALDHQEGDPQEKIMENWKKAVVAGAVGTSAILFLKRKNAGGVLAAGVGLAVLASEYPEKFRAIREELPYYVDRGTQFLEVVTRLGVKLTEVVDSGGRGLLEEFLAE